MASARRPGYFLTRSRTFLPILAASPTAGTMPTAAQKASPSLPCASASMPSRMSPTASSPLATWPRMNSGVPRDPASSSGQNRGGGVAADDPGDGVVDPAVVGERVAVVAVGVAVPVGVDGERVGVRLELLAVERAVPVRVDRGRVRAELELLAVAEPVAVAVGLRRVRAGLPLVGVRDAVAVRVGVRVAGLRRLLAAAARAAGVVGAEHLCDRPLGRARDLVPDRRREQREEHDRDHGEDAAVLHGGLAELSAQATHGPKAATGAPAAHGLEGPNSALGPARAA